MVWWTLAIALAADGDDEETSLEITVLGEEVERAREALVASIEQLGYDRAKERKDGSTVFRADQNWKGKVVLTREATLRVRRTGPRPREVEPIPGTRIRPYPLCIVVPTYCVSMGAWTVSDRRWGQVEDRVVDGTTTQLVDLSERLADAALAEKLEELPAVLELQWTEGASLFGRPPLATPEERRAELLEFWDTRTETVWGRQVRDRVAAFVRGEVQQSDHPYTDAEMAAFEASRRSAVPFPFTADPGLQVVPAER